MICFDADRVAGTDKTNLKVIVMRALIIALVVSLAPFAYADTIKGDLGSKIQTETIAQFNEPWAMARLNDDELLVTEKSGQLYRVGLDGRKIAISGVPEVAYGGQGGLGDVALHPEFEQNGLIYISAAITSDNGRARGAAVFRGQLDGDQLRDVQEIWRQTPFARGQGHYAHRLAFSTEPETGRIVLFITSGDRQLMTPAQDLSTSIGKLVRIYDDGGIPETNPYYGSGGPADSFWSVGHRNALGLAFAPDGGLWSVEMGPADGDELNLIEPAQNYGWPLVSEGNHYNGTTIPSHSTRPEFQAPVRAWVPTIAPSSISFMPAEDAGPWAENAFVSGLRSQSLFRLDMQNARLVEEERFDFDSRLRAVLALSDNKIFVLEDGRRANLLLAKRD